jgi:hypothetical protein
MGGTKGSFIPQVRPNLVVEIHAVNGTTREKWKCVVDIIQIPQIFCYLWYFSQVNRTTF